MGIYADKQFYGFRIQWLVKEIKTAFGRRVIHKANISETLLNEVVDGKWNQISLETLKKMEAELERVGYKIFDKLI